VARFSVLRQHLLSMERLYLRRGGCRSVRSLIWLNSVKRPVRLRSGKFHFFFRRCRHRLLHRVRDRNAFPAGIQAELRESTRHRGRGPAVINSTRSDAASGFVEARGSAVTPPQTTSKRFA